ncbi:MAG: CoA-binding protein, partial [Cyclobacteriaceae bacterium]|nr:CoA-binding protein [Cyclobacteriaceae bacterium]
KRIIFNPGTENTELEIRARRAGIEVVHGCTLVMLRTNQY